MALECDLTFKVYEVPESVILSLRFESWRTAIMALMNCAHTPSVNADLLSTSAATANEVVQTEANGLSTFKQLWAPRAPEQKDCTFQCSFTQSNNRCWWQIAAMSSRFEKSFWVKFSCVIRIIIIRSIGGVERPHLIICNFLMQQCPDLLVLFGSDCPDECWPAQASSLNALADPASLN